MFARARSRRQKHPRADMESAPTILFWPLGQNSTFFIIFYLLSIIYGIYLDFTAIFAIFQATWVIFLQKVRMYTITIAGGI